MKSHTVTDQQRTRSAPPDPKELEQVERLIDQFSHLQQQFDGVQQGLLQAHRLATLGTVATIIAHEYNNILTPVISYAQLAINKPNDADLQQKALQKALQGAQRAAHISSSLLGFAREDDEAAHADLEEVVHETLNCMGRDLQSDGIELELDLPDLQLAIPPLHLQQILLNLILNARKVMLRGGCLAIRAHVGDDGLGHIDVADNGPGIPEAIRQHIFEPFVTQHEPDLSGQRAADNDALQEGCDPGLADTAPGTGLGLCICRQLIQRAGGTITVTSERGNGTCFHITLPRA